MVRTLLVVGCLLLVILVTLGMRWGWKNRLKRQAGLPALPPLPVDLGVPLLEALIGVYVGTTFADSWQERIAHERLGLSATATATLYTAGVLIEREGEEPLFIPRGDLIDARLAPGLAGKVVGHGGLLVLRWRLGGGDAATEVDSGLRADDKSAYPQWIRAIQAKVGTA